MRHFIFISRHQPTQDQIEIAEENGIILHPVGDFDAFDGKVTDTIVELRDRGIPVVGMVVSHPAFVMRYAADFMIGTFKNEYRTPEGGTPQFKATGLFVIHPFVDYSDYPAKTRVYCKP